jgi:pimeloyl-ACP methyl ester carboxylesterase
MGPRASLIMALLAVGSVLGASVGPSTAVAATRQPSLPAGTGRDGVGVRSLFLYDHTRLDPRTHKPRILPVSVWYPTRRGVRGRRPRYMPPVVERAWEKLAAVPTGTFDASVPAIVDAPILTRGGRPVPLAGILLLLPGYQSAVAFQTNQAVELASRGYGVITFDSPGSGGAVAQPGGRVVLGAPASIVDELLGFSQRLRDAGFVLRNIPGLLPHARCSRVGILGHSLGGAVAAAALFHYPSFSAGLDFDGSPIGDVADFGLSKPFAVMLSYAHGPDPFLYTFELRTRGPDPRRTLHVLHFGFTDLALLTPEIGRYAPAVAQTLESELPTGTSTSVAAGRGAVEHVRQFVDGFFGHYLSPRWHRN